VNGPLTARQHLPADDSRGRPASAERLSGGIRAEAGTSRWLGGSWAEYRSHVSSPTSPSANGAEVSRVPIRMLHDRVLASVEGEAGERRSNSGIVIPATAAVGKRMGWSTVVAVGQHVRQVQVGDRVLYDPEERAEVELQGSQYILMRERDIHAVAAPRVEDGKTGLYL
jgi:chaperonin GroES